MFHFLPPLPTSHQLLTMISMLAASVSVACFVDLVIGNEGLLSYANDASIPCCWDFLLCRSPHLQCLCWAYRIDSGISSRSTHTSLPVVIYQRLILMFTGDMLAFLCIDFVLAGFDVWTVCFLCPFAMFCFTLYFFFYFVSLRKIATVNGFMVIRSSVKSTIDFPCRCSASEKQSASEEMDAS